MLCNKTKQCTVDRPILISHERAITMIFYVQWGRVINGEYFSQHYPGVGHWAGSVHCHSRRPETIASHQPAGEVCRPHISCRPISQRRQQEMDNIATWAEANNLTLNVLKSTDIVFQNSRQITAVTPPQPLPATSRENVLKILGVTITSHLSPSNISL